MKTLAELKAIAVDLQERMKPLNHKLENSQITLRSRMSIESSLRELKIFWYDAMCDVHSHPEYEGNFRFVKENNPYRN
ncbi:hypothetical protein bas12_0034 [Escherichia phage BrunoManser]|uniref:Uncharacterized protein n=1 Tax=Escherichia phage BrunoManser TaxID=2851976 RepID=A0AAE7VPP6_9CAUD|nr:hypothetical protein bas12_0034 [Escherichia phage BrunoManser]